MFPFSYSHWRSTHCFDALNGIFSHHLDVLRIKSFLTDTTKLWNSLLAKWFLPTFVLSCIKLIVNRYLISLDCFELTFLNSSFFILFFLSKSLPYSSWKAFACCMDEPCNFWSYSNMCDQYIVNVMFFLFVIMTDFDFRRNAIFKLKLYR